MRSCLLCPCLLGLTLAVLLSSCSPTASRWKVYRALEQLRSKASSSSALTFENGNSCYQLRSSDDKRYPVLLSAPCGAVSYAVIADLNVIFAGQHNGNVSLLKVSPDNLKLLLGFDPAGGTATDLFVYDFSSKRLLDIARGFRVYDALWSNSEQLLFTSRSNTASEGLPTRLVMVDRGQTKKILDATLPGGSLTFSQSSGRTFIREGNWTRSEWFEFVPGNPALRRLDAANATAVCATESEGYVLTHLNKPEGEILSLGSRQRVFDSSLVQGAISKISCSKRDILITAYRNGNRLLFRWSPQSASLESLCENKSSWCEPTGALALPRHIERKTFEARSRDLTPVPFDLFEATESSPNPSPILVYAYGAYGSVIEPELPEYAQLLVKNGWRFVIARVRGGGDNGPAWHLAGTGKHKTKSFEDLIAVRQTLVERGLARPDAVFGYGRSAGALLFAGAARLEPGLFKGLVLEAPLLSPLEAMSTPDRPLSSQELSEWGNPSDPAIKELIGRYSPRGITCEALPQILLIASRKDPIIPFDEVLAWVDEVKSRCPAAAIWTRFSDSALHDRDESSGEQIWKEVQMVEFLTALSTSVEAR